MSTTSVPHDEERRTPMIAIRLLFATLATLLAVAIAPALATAAPAVDGEFALTGKPVHLTQGPDGNMWVAMSDSTRGNDVAQVTPAGVVTEFDLPGITSTAGIVTGPDGKLWATHSTGGGGVFRFLPANPLGGADVAVSDITDARSIVVGPDGNVWTASGDKAIRITPVTVPVATPFTVTGMSAHDIARGGDGNLYIAEGGSGAGHVVGLTTAGVSTLYATGGGQGVAAGPGNQIAYTNPVNTPEQIGRITPGNLTPLITDQPPTDPTGIVLGSDGAYWIANFNSTALSRFTTDGQVTSLSGLSAASGPRWIATGPGDTLWVGLETAQRVARVIGVSAPRPTTPPTTPPTPPPAGSGDTTKPVASGLRLARRLRVGATTTIHVTLSEPASLKLTFERVRPGRRTASGRCAAANDRRRLTGGRPCTHFVRVTGHLAQSVGAGPVSFPFDGTIRRRLSVDSYRVTVVPTDLAGNVGAPVRARFAIVPRRRARRART